MAEDSLHDMWDWDGSPAPMRGLLACTPVATTDGWKPALDLRAGDHVLTFEHGPRPVCRLTQTLPSLTLPPPCWPLLLPAWALDNRDELRLLPDQMVLLETDLAEELYGDPFALLPAEALEGWRGITRCAPVPGEAVVELWFDRPAVLYASRALLLACPGRDGVALAHPAAAPDLIPTLGRTEPVPCSLAQARHLVACLIAEDVGGALRAPALPQAAAF
jgi:hypothetical protein